MNPQKFFAWLFQFRAAPLDISSLDRKPAGFEWPYCDSPLNDGCQSCSANGIPYRKVEIAPGSWQWRVDTEFIVQRRQDHRRRHELMWLLRTRVLTDGEMEEVEKYGEYLNIDEAVSYSLNEKSLELNSLFLQQFKLRTTARLAKGAQPTGEPVTASDVEGAM